MRAYLLSVTLILSLAGCGSESGEQKQTTDQAILAELKTQNEMLAKQAAEHQRQQALQQEQLRVQQAALQQQHALLQQQQEEQRKAALAEQQKAEQQAALEQKKNLPASKWEQFASEFGGMVTSLHPAEAKITQWQDDFTRATATNAPINGEISYQMEMPVGKSVLRYFFHWSGERWVYDKTMMRTIELNGEAPLGNLGDWQTLASQKAFFDRLLSK